MERSKASLKNKENFEDKPDSVSYEEKTFFIKFLGERNKLLSLENSVKLGKEGADSELAGRAELLFNSCSKAMKLEMCEQIFEIMTRNGYTNKTVEIKIKELNTVFSNLGKKDQSVDQKLGLINNYLSKF